MVGFRDTGLELQSSGFRACFQCCWAESFARTRNPERAEGCFFTTLADDLTLFFFSLTLATLSWLNYLAVHGPRCCELQHFQVLGGFHRYLLPQLTACLAALRSAQAPTCCKMPHFRPIIRTNSAAAVGNLPSRSDLQHHFNPQFNPY